MAWQLAQINIGRLRAPLEAPEMAEFAGALDRVNAAADASPGFVWRLRDDSGNATAIQLFDDPLILVNMSVWRDVDALRAFVYSGEHVAFLKRRATWFAKLDRGAPHLALWWIRAGAFPEPLEGRRRLRILESRGPGAEAFTFGTAPPAPAAA